MKVVYTTVRDHHDALFGANSPGAADKLSATGALCAVIHTRAGLCAEIFSCIEQLWSFLVHLRFHYLLGVQFMFIWMHSVV